MLARIAIVAGLLVGSRIAVAACTVSVAREPKHAGCIEWSEAIGKAIAMIDKR